MEAVADNSLVITSTRSSNGPLSSLSAFWKAVGNKKVYGPYERPPFPILIDKPSFADLVNEWRFSDYFMAGTIYGTGILVAFTVSRPLPQVMQRLLVYHATSHMFFIAAVSSMVLVPFRRLTGFWDNGLRWSKPEDRLDKFDSTSHFEKATGWSRFRVNLKE